MIKKAEIKLRLEELCFEQEFFRGFNLETGLNTQASINMCNYELNIRYNPEWIDLVFDKYTQKYLAKKNILKDCALGVLLRDVFIHEVGHRGTRQRQGCPETFEKLSDKFLDPIQKVVGFENKQNLMNFANCLTDLINNTAIKKLDEYGKTTLTGFYLFLKEQGMNLEKKGKQKFSKIYESHARLNLFFNGDEYDRQLIKKYFTHEPDINNAIQNFLSRIGVLNCKMEIGQSQTARDKLALQKYLMDENNWEKIAVIYSEEFSKFLLEDQDKQKEENLFGSGSGESSGGEGGDGGAGCGDGEGEESGGGEGEGDDKFKSGDGFGDELNRKENQKKLLKGKRAGNEPGWMTNFEFLITYYELLASDKLFDISMPQFKSQTYPLIGLSNREFDLDDDSVHDIIGLGMVGSKIELLVNEYFYSVIAKVKEEINQLPDMIFGLLDTSGSMLDSMPKGKRLGRIINPKAKNSPHWQEHSKYHVSLITYFMMIQRFEDLGISDSDVYLANFSYDTRLSRGLKNSLKEALSPQFGGTSINIQKIENILDKKNNLVFLLSDGEISNTAEILKKLIEINEYNPVFHIQIGLPSELSEKLEKNQIFVKYVNSEQELYDFAIEVTDTVYGGQK